MVYVVLTHTRLLPSGWATALREGTTCAEIDTERWSTDGAVVYWRHWTETSTNKDTQVTTTERLARHGAQGLD